MSKLFESEFSEGEIVHVKTTQVIPNFDIQCMDHVIEPGDDLEFVEDLPYEVFPMIHVTREGQSFHLRLENVEKS